MSCGPVANYSTNGDGAGTIACDGSGGYEPVLNSFEGEHCGVGQCAAEHEQSHIDDWENQYGMCVGPRGSDPPMGGPGYDGFLQQSECKGYNTEFDCNERNFQNASPECQPYIQERMEELQQSREDACQASYP